MSERNQYTDPEEISENSTEREKELSGQFDDPGFDFIFAEEKAS